MIIQYKKHIHYLLIYFMLVMNQSNLYQVFIKDYQKFIFAGCIILFFIIKKYRSLYTLGFLLFLLLSTLFVRYTSGGIGVDFWINKATFILFTVIVVQYNKRMFFPRLIKMVVFLAGLSLVMFTAQLLFPSLFNSNLFIQFNSPFAFRNYTNAFDYFYVHYPAHGLLFFTFSEREMTRNLGMFTEPGIYQMVLNTALFLMLFFRDNLHFSKKKQTQYILILILAIITSQSTTGYIGMFSIVLVYLFSKKKRDGRLHLSFYALIIIGLIAIILDYQIREEDSFLYKSIIDKLFSSGSFNLASTSSGAARTGTIILSLSSILLHPLGIGIDNFNLIIDNENTGYVAAQIIQTGAILGVMPLLGIFYWLFMPIVRNNIGKNVKILFIFLYFNTTLAQSNEFYPLLICIPICLHSLDVANRYSKIGLSNRKFHITQ